VRGIDFSERPGGTPALGWALLIAGAASCAAAMAWSARAGAAATAAQTRLDERRADLARASRPKPVAPPTLQSRRLAQAERDLAAPWLAALRGIENSAVEPVYLRSLTIEPSSGAIRVEAEAPRLEEALEFVRGLDGDPLMSPAALTSHQAGTDPIGGAQIVVFGASAKWPSQ
jgi:hypothetical protein